MFKFFKKWGRSTEANPRRNITDYFLSRTDFLHKQPECTPGRQEYSMFTDGAVEVEVGEFLYAFVRMIKPARILETGTHHGVSGMYMAQALKENGRGELVTLEIFHENILRAKKLWGQTGVLDWAQAVEQRSLDFESKDSFDLLFLDSEPDTRFDELVKFYPHLNPGGFILVHDLHPNLSISPVEVNGMKHWPYGDFRPKFGDLMKSYQLQTVTFRTPRGFTLFQKAASDFSHTNFLQGKMA